MRIGFRIQNFYVTNNIPRSLTSNLSGVRYRVCNCSPAMCRSIKQQLNRFELLEKIQHATVNARTVRKSKKKRIKLRPFGCCCRSIINLFFHFWRVFYFRSFRPPTSAKHVWIENAHLLRDHGYARWNAQCETTFVSWSWNRTCQESGLHCIL